MGTLTFNEAPGSRRPAFVRFLRTMDGQAATFAPQISMKHLVLVDGHHLMYRAYWAIPRTLKTRSGEQTNTSFGMASMLLAILAAEHPDGLVLCFDAGEKTFRHLENAEYKEG